MLTIEMLPVAHGDCLWIEYGHPNAPNRILIDGGPHHTYDALRSRILDLPPERRQFELLVVTHIDADHIDGIVKLLQDDALGVTFGDVWFNGWKHIENLALGGPSGEFLGALLEVLDLPWNEAFGGGVIVVPDDGDLETKTLPGGAELTIVSPTKNTLRDLRRDWDRAVRAAGFEAGDRDTALAKLRERKDLKPPSLPLGDKDDSEANGSSIAFVLEADGMTCLFSGDAFPDVLLEGMQRLDGGARRRLKLDVFKLPHHGSIKNMSRELAEKVDARHILVSTSGAIFKHPNVATIDALIDSRGSRKQHFVFNYRTEFNSEFADVEDQEDRRYTATYPRGAVIELS